MKVLHVTILFFVVCGSAALLKRGKRSRKKVSEADIALLTSVYSLGSSHMGGFTYGTTWQSSKIISGAPEGTTFLMLLKNDECAPWVEFDRNDRLYMWHGGKAMIDLIDEHGNLTTKCLGDPLTDPNCRYLVLLPSGWKSDIRIEGYVLLTGIMLMGPELGGTTKYDYKYMEDAYPDHYDVIKLTKHCYG